MIIYLLIGFNLIINESSKKLIPIQENPAGYPDIISYTYIETLPEGTKLSNLSYSFVQETLKVKIAPKTAPYFLPTGSRLNNNNKADKVDYKTYPKSPFRLSIKGFSGERYILGFIYNPYQYTDSGLVIHTKEVRINIRTAHFTMARKASGGPEYLFITTDEFADTLRRYKEILSKMGIHSQIITINEIEGRWTGVDLQEKIRNCIKDYWKNYALKWVLLVGDVEDVPTRYAWIKPTGFGALDLIPEEGVYIPTDYYYACLDGNWDFDGDGIFGEGSIDRHIDGTSELSPSPLGVDRVDLLPEIQLGRLSVHNNTELNNYIDKVERYVFHPESLEIDSILLIGAMLDASTDAGVFKDSISSLFPSGYVFTRLYASLNNLNRDSVLNYLSRHYWIINHADHSGPLVLGTGIKTGGGMIYDTDIDNISQDMPLSILYSIGCEANAYDWESWGEKWVRSNSGGLCFIGNARYGWYKGGAPGEGPSDRYDISFFDNLLSSNTIGEAFNRSKVAFAPFSAEDNLDRWIQFSLSLAGAPEIPVYTTLNPISATIPETLKIGDTLSIGIGSPIGQEATISFGKGDSLYYWWKVKIPDTVNTIPNLKDTGDYWISITGNTLIPVVKNIRVIPSISIPVLYSISPLYLSPESIDTVSLAIKNQGNDTIRNISILLSSADRFLNITPDSLYIGNIPPFGIDTVFSEFITGAYPDYLPNLHPIKVSYKIKSTLILEDSFYIYIADDSIQYLYHNFTKRGDTIFIYNFTLQNIGENSTAPISIIGMPSSLMIDSIAEGGSILKDSLSVIQDTISFIQSAIDSPYLKIMDGENQIDSIPFSYSEIPPPPDSLWIRTDTISLPPKNANLNINWAYTGFVPPQNITGYIVQRSDGKRSFLPYSASSYLDKGLLFNTTYTYNITPINRFGNLGNTSISISDKTPPPLFPNFPFASAPTKFSSPVVADLNNDGIFEIVVAGAGSVFVYEPDGTIFANWPQPITPYPPPSTPAVSDIDGDDSLEVVVNSDSVYIFKWNGNRYPNWPKKLNGSTYTHPMIADLNNDGIPEIIYATGSGYLNIFEPDGTLVLTQYIGYPAYISAGDINGDSTLDIIVSVKNTTGASMLAINISGDTLWEDTTFQTSMESPLIADIDKDGKYDIADIFSNALYIWKNGLTARIYVPLNAPRGPILLSDVNGDGYPEIITGNLYGSIYAIDKDGNLVQKWHTNGGSYRPGITEDGGKIFVDAGNIDTRYCLIYGFNGKDILPGFPFRYEGYSFSSPTISDIDGDTMIDLVFTNADGKLYIWKTDIPFGSGWHKDYYDNENTSFFRNTYTYKKHKHKHNLSIFYLLKNPCIISAKFFINSTSGGKVKIFDILGRMVKAKDIPKGFNGVISIQLPASGIYFARFEHRTLKFILLR